MSVNELLEITNYLIILILMMMASMMLSLDRKTKSKKYLKFFIYFAISMIPYVCFLVFYYFDIIEKLISSFFDFLTALSYLLIQMTYFQLIKPKEKKSLRIYLAMILIVLVVSILSIFFPLLTHMNSILKIIFTIFFYHWTLTILGNKMKFRLALYIYGTSATIGFVQIFIANNILSLLETTFAMLFFYMMFVVFFERIVDMIQAVTYSSVTDALTGLFNRKYFLDKTKDYISNKVGITVIFIDIDNFKRLNDTQGHHTGDEVLKFVSRILKEVIDGKGICARFGGEEMIALISDLKIDVAEVAELFRYRVEMESKEIAAITVSIGFCKYLEGIDSAEQLIKKSDDAMYFSKNNGKNRVTNFQEMNLNEETT